MGLPYSREINQAFDQVSPLVIVAYEVLESTKKISILLAIIQVLTVLLLTLLLLVGLGILISINPQLEHERDVLVTPAVRRLCGWAIRLIRALTFLMGFLYGLLAGGPSSGSGSARQEASRTS
jgi:hypothetical protein